MQSWLIKIKLGEKVQCFWYKNDSFHQMWTYFNFSSGQGTAIILCSKKNKLSSLNNPRDLSQVKFL